MVRSIATCGVPESTPTPDTVCMDIPRSNAAAKELLAGILERLAYGSEAATWRNCFLTGAYELRNEVQHSNLNSAGVAPALTTTQLFDSIAIRVNGPRAWGESLSINWIVTDEDTRYRMELSNGALVHFPSNVDRKADATLTLTRTQLLGLLLAGNTDGVSIEGDAALLGKVVALTETPDPDFAIVLP